MPCIVLGRPENRRTEIGAKVSVRVLPPVSREVSSEQTMVATPATPLSCETVMRTTANVVETVASLATTLVAIDARLT